MAWAAIEVVSNIARAARQTHIDSM
jgi:hypothetical protein